MAIPTPQEAARRWAANTKAAKKSYEAGIRAVTSSPMEKAASKAQQYADGVARAVSEGRYQAGLRSVSIQQWQDAALGKGLARLDSGVTAAEPKMLAFQSEVLPFIQQVQNTVRNMPNNTEEERDQRMLANARLMRGFRRSGTGRAY